MIVSSAVTQASVGCLYTYDVDASGNPPPTYTLTTKPTGMTIDENTGLISWTPEAIGDYDVVVEAHNSEGVDPQSFVLSVSEPPPFALRINCGGSTVVDGDITWESSDPYITGGANYTFPTSSVDTTTNSIEEPIPPLEVYKACRHQSPHTYSFPSVPNGDYIVRIHWIDQVTSAGLREIDYDIEGVRVEEDWDVYAEAGGTFVAIDKEYEVTVSDGNGLQITSSADSGDAFESAIEITVRQDEAPTITSDPVIQAYVGVPYSYDVEATGYPAPTYTLTIAPPGMTIDEDSGEISWTPTATGDYDVTVQASNSEGTDEQAFTIHVAAITPCPLDMTSYWKLDETSGTTYDDSYDDNDGACAGACPSPTTDGKVNGGQVFDGDTTGIDVPADTSFDWAPNDSFSIEFWMKRPGVCAAFDVPHNEVIVGRDDASTDLHWWVGVSCNHGGKALFGLVDKDAGGDDAWAVGGTDVTGGLWHHIVAVRNADENEISIYVDGKEEDSVPAMFSADFDSSTAALNLGWLNLSPDYHFEGTLDEIALYNRALTEKEIKTHYYLARGYCEACESAIDIMPLGDSITVGNASGVVPDDEAHWVSYRKDLWESLGTAGYDVDFVGGQSHGYAFDPPFDSDHEGHGGWTDSQIRDDVVSFLTANPADVVLLHIGTNGLDPDPGQVEQILDNIDSVSEDITVVLARIINRRDGSTTTTQFNDNVEAMALARMDPTSPDYTGDKIIIVDMENEAGIVYGQAPSDGDMWDNLHPYETGYAKMANVWLHGDSHGSDGLEDFLPLCAPPEPEPPVITSTPVTEAYEGKPYMYDVEASGYPAPTYTLSVAPAGMTINETTGLISWTPAATGDYSVTVEAWNVMGMDSQPFTIHVSEAPPCPLDMTSYWKLDEMSSGAYLDFYDGNNNGHCAGVCPTPATDGRVLNAQVFNGTSTGIDVPADASFDWGKDDSFTIEFWMKRPGDLGGGTSNNEVLVGRDDASTDLHWWFGIHNTYGYAHFQLADKTHDTVTLEGPDVTDGEWHHLVGVRDGVAGINRLYVDGVEVASEPHTYLQGFDSATAALNLGWLNLSGGYHFEGTLDEVALYNRALSDAEVYQHYLNGLAGKGYCEALGSAVFLTKKASVNMARVGDDISYTYTILNVGGEDLDPVTLVDDKLGTIIATTDGITLAAGTSATFTETYTVQVSDLPGSIVNLATATGYPDEGEPVTDTSTVSVELINPSIQVIKEADPLAVGEGDVVTYIYTISNTGDSILTNVTLTDDKLGEIELTPAQVTDGLQVLYTFEEGSGTTVHDVSGAGTPLDLTIGDEANVSWIPDGGLSLDASTIVASDDPATKIVAACQTSNELTIEAWVKPTNTTQGGGSPPRIVTLSANPSAPNFSLHQDETDYLIRLRTTGTDQNGMPTLTGGGATTDLSHVIFTRDAGGGDRIYVNSIEVVNRSSISGDFSNWDDTMHFALGNEFEEDRTWLGEYHLIAIYNRALSQAEVNQNYEAGGGSVTLLPDQSITATATYTVLPGDCPIVNEATASGQPPIGDPVTNTDTATVECLQKEFSWPLVEGWNLISFPISPVSTVITEVLSTIEGSYDLVYAHDAMDTADPWKKYNVAAPPFLNDLTEVNETMGLWIRANEAVTLTVSGLAPSSTDIALRTGWNLVGYPSQTTRPLTEALQSIQGKYDLIYAYDATDTADPWKKYNVAAPPFLNDLTEMGSGYGYWISVTEDCVWTVEYE